MVDFVFTLIDLSTNQSINQSIFLSQPNTHKYKIIMTTYVKLVYIQHLSLLSVSVGVTVPEL